MDTFHIFKCLWYYNGISIRFSESSKHIFDMMLWLRTSFLDLDWFHLENSKTILRAECRKVKDENEGNEENDGVLTKDLQTRLLTPIELAADAIGEDSEIVDSILHAQLILYLCRNLWFSQLCTAINVFQPTWFFEVCSCYNNTHQTTKIR